MQEIDTSKEEKEGTLVSGKAQPVEEPLPPLAHYQEQPYSHQPTHSLKRSMKTTDGTSIPSPPLTKQTTRERGESPV